MKLMYEDQIVIVKDKNGDEVYRGMHDYNPYKYENWKYDRIKDIYTINDRNFGTYTMEVLA